MATLNYQHIDGYDVTVDCVRLTLLAGSQRQSVSYNSANEIKVGRPVMISACGVLPFILSSGPNWSLLQNHSAHLEIINDK